MLTAYLVLYNAACAVGWAYVLYLTLLHAASGPADARTLWAALALPLTAVQSAAALEVAHAALGLVSSPVLTVAIQVSSRLILVWGYTRPFAVCQGHWSLYLMAASWALSEVPRYAFYVLALRKGVPPPFPLFWLRYSLFLALYPTGILGELLQVWTALQAGACTGVGARATACLLALYVVGSPYMILNMWGNRKRSFKKREADAKPPAQAKGLVWPVTSAATGERGSTPTNQAIWAQALGAVDKGARAGVEAERNWRFGYARHAERSVQLALASEADALAMARAGLAAAQASFRFRRGDREVPLVEAMKAPEDMFITGMIQGQGWRPLEERSPSRAEFALQVPYGGGDPTRPYYLSRDSKTVLSGDALIAQLDRWQQWGTIEPSAAESIKAVAKNNEWMDLSDRYFVLLGATSAMGPLDLLLHYGANIIAVDIDRPGVWEKIIAKARASRGTVYFPLSKAKVGAKEFAAFRGVTKAGVEDFTAFKGSDAALAQASGANLLECTPEICAWLQTVCPGKDLTVGNYTYLDGALHVQLSIGCDAIIEGLCKGRGTGTSIAFLCTPTDLHVIPKEAHQAAETNYAAYPLWLRGVAALGTKALQRNSTPPIPCRDSKGDIYYVDGLSIAQGPNYCLAKRLQHWRAIVARGAGHRVSSNIAPSTATASVTSNFMFQMAYGGFHIFRPLEVMYQCVPPRARAPL